MSCGCNNRVDVVDQAVKTKNLRLLRDRLERENEKQRTETIRLLVKNGNPILYPLIQKELKNFSEDNQVLVVLAAAVAANEDLLDFLLSLEDTFYEDTFIDTLYRYDQTINPNGRIVGFIWQHLSDYERNSIDISIRQRYYPYIKTAK